MNATRFVCLVACCLTCFGSTALTAEPSPFIASYADPIESFLEERFAGTDAGMVIGIVDGKQRRVFAAGALDNGTGESVDGDSIFALGSVTKVFTSLLLLDSVRRGEMSLDDPLSKYLPDQVKVPSFNAKPITLLSLGAQDSGLPFHAHDVVVDPDSGQLDLRQFKAAAEKVTWEDLYRLIGDYELEREPGESFQYSNVGMALLGHALEQRTGKGYEALVLERICGPLGMSDTAIKFAQEKRVRLVQGHLADGSKVGHWNFRAMGPAGTLFSTANDMLTFLSAQLELVESPLADSMRESHKVRHASSARFGRTCMPWVDSGVYNPPGSDLRGHAGHGLGGLAFIAMDIKKKRGVVVLTNQLNTFPNAIGWTIVQGMPFSGQNITNAVREIVGLGISLGEDADSDFPKVVFVFPQSPAGQADVPSNVLIRAINGVSAKGKSPQEAIQMMPGPAGSSVTLELFDPAGDETLTVELTKSRFLTMTEA